MGIGFVGQVTRAITVEEATQVGQVRREAQVLAQLADFAELDAGRVTLAAVEIATNVLRHGRGGRVLLSLVQGRTSKGVEVCGIDRGPGFSLSDCLPDGYSTGGTPGQGLGAIKRQAQVFDVWSDARGAIVLARIYGERTRNEDLGYGALRLPMRQEPVCGDAWFVSRDDGGRTSGVLVDGLGHGLLAAEAADAGISAAAEGPELAADEVLARMHARMSPTRGGAAAAFVHEPESGVVRFAGVGNIAAAIHEPGQPSRGLASHPGIVGSQHRRTPAFVVPAAPGALLLMHSDGLQTRWSLSQYEGLVYRHPALVLAVLLRDFDRGRDDTGALAVRLEAQRDQYH